MTDTEMNEFCARELGWRQHHTPIATTCGDGDRIDWMNPKGELVGGEIPNFLTSESANAMLRDEIFANFLQQFERKERPDNLWLRLVHLANLIKGQCPTEQDYKRAIVLAFIEWRQHA